jgi:hypothetical protein
LLGELPVATLAEALDQIDGRVLFVLELKEAGFEERVASLMRSRKAAGWCWIWSFDRKVVAASRAALSVGMLTDRVGERPCWRS